MIKIFSKKLSLVNKVAIIVVSLLVGSCVFSNDTIPKKKIDITAATQKKVGGLKKELSDNIKEEIESLTPQSDIKEISSVNDRLKSYVEKSYSKYKEWYQSFKTTLNNKGMKLKMRKLNRNINKFFEGESRSATKLYNNININIQEYEYIKEKDGKNSKKYQKEIVENLLLKLHKRVGLHQNKKGKTDQRVKYYEKKTKLSFTPNKNTSKFKMLVLPHLVLGLSILSLGLLIPITGRYLWLIRQKVSHFLFFHDYYNNYKYFARLDNLYKHRFPNGKYNKEWKELKIEIIKQQKKGTKYKFTIKDKKLKKLAKELNLEKGKKRCLFANSFKYIYKNKNIEVKEISTKDNKKVQTAYFEKEGGKVILLVSAEGSFACKFNTIKYKHSCFVVTNNSTRTPSRESVNIDYEAAYEYLVKTKGIKPEDIIVMGYCRGSEAATHIARKYKPGKLILVSPPYKVKDVDFNYTRKDIYEKTGSGFGSVLGWILCKVLRRLKLLLPEDYNFAVGKLKDKVTCPVHIMCDKTDKMFVYEKNGLKIYKENEENRNVKLHTFRGMGHDIFDSDEKYNKVKEVMFDIIDEKKYNNAGSDMIYHK